jgi:hypothetical protein
VVDSVAGRSIDHGGIESVLSVVCAFIST